VPRVLEKANPRGKPDSTSAGLLPPHVGRVWSPISGRITAAEHLLQITPDAKDAPDGRLAA
jgi:hypothetical protein